MTVWVFNVNWKIKRGHRDIYGKWHVWHRCTRMTELSVQYLVVLLPERVVVFVREGLFYKRYGREVWRGSRIRNVIFIRTTRCIEGREQTIWFSFGKSLDFAFFYYQLLLACTSILRFWQFKIWSETIRATTTGNTGSCKSLHEEYIYFLNVISLRRVFQLVW